MIDDSSHLPFGDDIVLENSLIFGHFDHLIYTLLSVLIILTTVISVNEQSAVLNDKIIKFDITFQHLFEFFQEHLMCDNGPWRSLRSRGTWRTWKTMLEMENIKTC